MVYFFIGVLVGKFGVEESVLDVFFIFNVCGLILVSIGRDDGIADKGFWQIFSISCFKDLIVL